MPFADPQPLMRAVDDLRDVVLANRDAADRLRRLPDAIADALVKRNLYRLLLPGDLGGLEADVVTYWDMIEGLSAIDGSVGWNLAIAGGGCLIAGQLPRPIAREIFATPSACVAGSGPPTGHARAVDGGQRVSGRWSWASGIHQSTWVFAGCLRHEGDPPAPVRSGPPIGHVIVPRSSVRVLDTWHVGGLRGTGSTDFEISDLFVPSERCFLLFLGTPVHDAPIFRLPATFFGVALAAVALGIARGAIEAFAKLAAEKRPLMSSGRLAERPNAQHDLARAEATVESSRDYLRSALEEMWQTVLAGAEVGLPLRARVRRAQTHAADAAARAVGWLYRAAGGSSLYETCPLERAFRDVNAALGHVTLQRGMTEDAGRVKLGMKPLSPLF